MCSDVAYYHDASSHDPTSMVEVPSPLGSLVIKASFPVVLFVFETVITAHVHTTQK